MQRYKGAFHIRIIAYALRTLARINPMLVQCILRYLPHSLTICEAEVTYQRVRLLVNTGESIGRRLFYRQGYETQQELLFAKLINGGLVFDIGANIGIYSLLAMRRGARVIAFEPSRLALRYLMHNIALNSAGVVTVVPEAIAEYEGAAMFFETRFTNLGVGRIFRFGRAARENNPREYHVPCNTLDGYIVQFGMPDIIKMDIEGAEYWALSGGSRMLGHPNSPILLVEFHPVELSALGYSVNQCFEILTKYKYHSYRIANSDRHQWYVFSKQSIAHLVGDEAL